MPVEARCEGPGLVHQPGQRHLAAHRPIISTWSGTKNGENTPTAIGLAPGACARGSGAAIRSIRPLGGGQMASRPSGRPPARSPGCRSAVAHQLHQMLNERLLPCLQFVFNWSWGSVIVLQRPDGSAGIRRRRPGRKGIVSRFLGPETARRGPPTARGVRTPAALK